MIDADLIKSNIPEIKEENIPAIVELVNNTHKKDLEDSETKGFGEGRKDAFNKVDEVVAKYGYPRKSGLTSEHYGNVLATLKEAQMDESTKTKLTDLEKVNKELGDQLKDKNPDFEKKEHDYKTQIQVLKDANKEQIELFDKQKISNKQDLIKLHLKAEMPKIKDTIGDKTKELHVNQAINELIKSADFDDKGKVIFRNEENEILYNSANKNNPFTIDEMFAKNEYFKEIIDEGRTQTGLGSDKNGKQTKKFSMSITGAKSQVEADEIIRNSLIQQGITQDNPEFHTKFTEIRKENNVTQLPIQ